MQTILDYAFNQMGIRTIKLEVLRTNVRAISLYRKFNFKTISQKGDFIHMELRDEVGKFLIWRRDGTFMCEAEFSGKPWGDIGIAKSPI